MEIISKVRADIMAQAFRGRAEALNKALADLPRTNGDLIRLADGCYVCVAGGRFVAGPVEQATEFGADEAQRLVDGFCHGLAGGAMRVNRRRAYESDVVALERLAQQLEEGALCV